MIAEPGKRTGMEKDTVGPWILGAVMGLIALLGLFLASRAQDDIFYATGLGLFVFGVLFIFALIRSAPRG